jgi:hypothetical protein
MGTQCRLFQTVRMIMPHILQPSSHLYLLHGSAARGLKHPLTQITIYLDQLFYTLDNPSIISPQKVFPMCIICKTPCKSCKLKVPHMPCCMNIQQSSGLQPEHFSCEETDPTTSWPKHINTTTLVQEPSLSASSNLTLTHLKFQNWPFEQSHTWP